MDERRSRWLVGLRRHLVSGTALDRWIDDHGITGVVYAPGSYVLEDAAAAIASLVEAGASPDAGLLWDLAVTDVRDVAEALSLVHRETDGTDGFVAVWLDADVLVDPTRATGAARSVVSDVGRPNVAVAFAWQGARAGSLTAIVSAGIPVALGGVDGDDARTAVHRAVDKGMEKRREQALAEDEDLDASEIEDVPVLLLGDQVELVNEIGMLASGRGAPPRIPTVAAAEQQQAAEAVERLATLARAGGSDDAYGDETFARVVGVACSDLERDDVVERIWSRDHTVWREDPAEIADRLGWLDVAETMASRAADLTRFGERVRSGGAIGRVLLAGMGGSSLAPELFASVLGAGVPMTVLDSTNPDHVQGVLASIDLDRTLVVVSSKSGTTAETRSHLELLWSKIGRGDRFVVVTDEGTPLDALATERGFAEVFRNPSDIGGRYSALSLFGLVPAAICGIDPLVLLRPAIGMMRRCGACVPSHRNPGARLGAALAQAALDGREKVTFVLPDRLAPLGAWIEQLIAESTGKDGGGILPVLGEEPGPPEAYEDDRLFVAYTVDAEPLPPALEALEPDHPVVRIRIPSVTQIGAECFRWEFAVAVAAHILEVHPFDQPDVESAKAHARDALEGPTSDAVDPGSAQ